MIIVVIWMVSIAVFLYIGAYVQTYVFGIMGENVTFKLR